MEFERSTRRSPRRTTIDVLLAALACFGCLDAAEAQQQSFERLQITNQEWLQPFPGFRVVGSLYYVGGYDLASYLITTPEGHILINTGAYDSVDMIRSSIESLGFEFDDIEVLLTTQAHWDHVADLATIKRLTGARLFAHEDDVASLEDGGVSDFRYPDGRSPVFEPVRVDRHLQNGSTIELGGTVLTLHHHPGHTKGASSFSFTTADAGRDYSVLIVNMGSINPGVELLNMRAYPAIAADYAATFRAQKALSADIWVSSHASHFDLHDRVVPGAPYDPTRFMDPAGYAAKIDEYERRYLAQLEEERARRSR
jgi:metallo-beta-lactamase class B